MQPTIMKNRRGWWTGGVCLLIFALLLVSSLTDQNVAAQEKDKKSAPKLAGEWKFNQAQSDSVSEKMQKMMPSAGGGFPAGGPPPGFGGGGLPSEEEMKTMREKMERSLAAPESLQISQSETEVTINESGGIDRSRSFYLDGRKSKQDGAESKAKIKKSQLLVETKVEKGPKVIESYELAADGKQLIVFIKIETDFGGGLKLRRIYDAV